jgi:hypothetical protein
MKHIFKRNDHIEKNGYFLSESEFSGRGAAEAHRQGQKALFEINVFKKCVFHFCLTSITDFIDSFVNF